MCVTLAENYIFKALMTYFNQWGWHARIEYVTSSSSTKPSPFHPFIVSFSRPNANSNNRPAATGGSGTGMGTGGLITVGFDALGTELSRFALTSLAEVQDKVRDEYLIRTQHHNSYRILLS